MHASAPAQLQCKLMCSQHAVLCCAVRCAGLAALVLDCLAELNKSSGGSTNGGCFALLVLVSALPASQGELGMV